MDLKLTTRSQEAMASAVRRASTDGHPQVEPAHLLAALLQQPDGVAPAVLAAVGADVSRTAAEAEKALREAAELSPFSPEIRAHLGEALLKLERLEDALAQWERALAYAFPGRERLEQRARELRVRIARAQGGLDPVPEADAGDDAPHGEPEGAEDPGEEEEEDD